MKKVETGGITFCSILAIVFIVLKLAHFIDWSWIWVLAPIWIPTAIAFIISLIFLTFLIFVFAIGIIIEGRDNKWD